MYVSSKNVMYVFSSETAALVQLGQAGFIYS
jgi:hypothetical protein